MVEAKTPTKIQLDDRELVQGMIDSGDPYFGPRFSALQGIRRRHAYMQAVVKLLSSEGVTGPLILEVGSWAGGSAVTWGKALQKYCSRGKVVCVDHWKPYFDMAVNKTAVYSKMDSAAREGLILNLFLHNIRATGVEDLVVVLQGDSQETLPLLKPGSFDIAFIDASHAYKDVLTDIRLCQNLLRVGGVICGDDLELQLHECPIEFTRKVAAEERDYVWHPDHKEGFHPGVALAVGDTFGPVSSWEGFWAMRKTATGWHFLDLPTPEPGHPPHLG